MRRTKQSSRTNEAHDVLLHGKAWRKLRTCAGILHRNSSTKRSSESYETEVGYKNMKGLSANRTYFMFH
jgi:hypothetical protein